MQRAALIMAGGRGERFWPKSRAALPKQFISLTEDGKTMIELTVERISSLVEPEHIFIATSACYKDLVQEQLPMIPEDNIILEPVGRNTAPCIALGAAHIQNKLGDAVMIVLPSDHIIKYSAMFQSALTDAAAIAEQGNYLLTIGITPTHPETGYGYIQFDHTAKKGGAFLVKRFVEKPNFETAQSYIESEEYLWNSGMFVWKASSILTNIKMHMPKLYSEILKITEVIGTEEEEELLQKIYPTIEPISIDYGVMEKAEQIYTIPGMFGWDDVGSWNALERMQKTNEFGNIVKGNVVAVDTKNCTIQGEKRLIATIGLEDLVIVDTEDVLLLCKKQSTWDIKRVLETLRICDKQEFL